MVISLGCVVNPPVFAYRIDRGSARINLWNGTIKVL